MMVGYTFANWNMAYYPPSNRTRLHQACTLFQDPHRSALARLRAFLVDALGDDNDHDHDPTQPGCFDMRQQLPSGPNATISAGDWSGVGTGPSGESWDFQTCTLCVEAIGFGSSSDNDNDNSGMFPNRQWTLDWLTKHCQSRFGVTPQPYSLNQRWHIDDITATNVTHILFTNGLQDGWSVSGVLHNLSETVLALNFPHGAHHSDLSGPTDDDTDDIQQGRVQIQRILAGWLEELPGSQFQQQRRQRDEPPPLENVEVSEQS